jgi:xylan 1,4-beta-xylosidase
VSGEPIFGTRKKGYRPELALSGGYDYLEFTDTQDPYQETGHNALFEGPDGALWTSCHYFMDKKRPYHYNQSFQSWEKFPK